MSQRVRMSVALPATRIGPLSLVGDDGGDETGKRSGDPVELGKRGRSNVLRHRVHLVGNSPSRSYRRRGVAIVLAVTCVRPTAGLAGRSRHTHPTVGPFRTDDGRAHWVA
jgi:hypothetical protein